MRPGTTLVLAGLLLVIIVAATIQLLFISL